MNKTAIVSNNEFAGLLGNFSARGIAYSWSDDGKSAIATKMGRQVMAAHGLYFAGEMRWFVLFDDDVFTLSGDTKTVQIDTSAPPKKQYSLDDKQCHTEETVLSDIHSSLRTISQRIQAARHEIKVTSDLLGICGASLSTVQVTDLLRSLRRAKESLDDIYVG
jgi:predicted DNA-binding helix-hairpin-helix protein